MEEADGPRKSNSNYVGHALKIMLWPMRVIFNSGRFVPVTRFCHWLQEARVHNFLVQPIFGTWPPDMYSIRADGVHGALHVDPDDSYSVSFFH